MDKRLKSYRKKNIPVKIFDNNGKFNRVIEVNKKTYYSNVHIAGLKIEGYK